MKSFIEIDGITTDGALTEQGRYAMLPDTAIEVTLRMAAFGNNNAAAWFERTALLKRVGEAAPVLVNSSVPLIVNELSSVLWAVSPAIQGNDVIINTTGAAGVRVNWNGSLVGHEVTRT